MAMMAAAANGNLTTAATWGVIDATSVSVSQGNVTTVPNTAGAGSRSSSFTPGAITIDGIGIKVSARIGTTGTVRVLLRNITGAADVAGTTVTINMSDILAADATRIDGSWVFFKFAAPVLLIVATQYAVDVITSSATQLSLFVTTGTNWSRYLRTTTNTAPAAGDDFIITGEWTAAATVTARTVTMDSTTATDYGSAGSGSAQLTAPSVSVTNNGTLIYGVAAATNYILRISGNLMVYLGGTLNIGTTGTPMPRDSSAVLEFDCPNDGDYGLWNRSGIITMQGLSRTVGNNSFFCKLNTDEVVNSTSLGVDTDTGWLDNDLIAVATTTRTASQSEQGALNGNATATTLTVDGFAGAGGGLAAAHSGTAPTQAEIILLTRNVKLRGVTSTLMTFLYCNQLSVTDIDWTEFRYLGSTGPITRGIEVDCTSGTFSMEYSSLYNCDTNGLYFNTTSITGTPCVVNNCVFWSLGTSAATVNGLVVDNTLLFTNNIMINTSLSTLLSSTSISFACNGNTFVGGQVVIGITGTTRTVNPAIRDNTIHGSSGIGMLWGGNQSREIGVLSGFIIWRCVNQGMQMGSAMRNIIFKDFVMFGNTTSNIDVTGGSTCTFENLTSNGDTTFATTNGLNLGSSAGTHIQINNSNFSTVSGIKTAHTVDIAYSAAGAVQGLPINVHARDSIFGGTNIITGGSALTISAYDAFTFEGFGGSSSADHRAFFNGGRSGTDTVIFNTASPSQRLTPNSATVKCPSAPIYRGLQVPVDSGVGAAVTVYLRKSVVGDPSGANYNGNQPRLIVRANPALGLDADSVLDTMTVAIGNWEQLSGSAPSASANGVFEFYVDCDGTAGWVNVDDWVVTNSSTVGDMICFYEGLPYVGLVTQSITPGGGGSASFSFGVG